MNASAVIERRTAELDRLREVVVMMLAATIPLSTGAVIWSAARGPEDFNHWVSIAPFDVPLAILIALAIAKRRHSPRGRNLSWVSRLGLALATILGVAFIAHPSVRGVDFAFHVAGGLGAIDAIRRLGRDARQRILAVIVAIGSVEGLLAMAEAVNGGELGLGPLEFTGFFFRFGTSTAAHVGFVHPYHLACFLLVALGAALTGAMTAERRAPWFGGAALAAAGLSVTYSRSALITLVILVAIAVFARGERSERRTRRMFAATFGIAFLLGAVGFGDGWVTRARTTATAAATGSSADVDSNRTDRAREALRLIRRDPILGVGPGLYTIAVESVPHTDLLPAHNAVLHEGAEGGVIAGVLTAALLIALALRSMRSGPEAAFVFVALFAYFVLDAYPYTFPAGIAMTGLWLGVQDISARESDVPA